MEAIGPFVFGTDGKGAKNLIIPAGGMRLRPDAWKRPFPVTMAPAIFAPSRNCSWTALKFSTFRSRPFPRPSTSFWKKAGMTLDEVDFFVFHQANKFMLEALRRKLRIPKEKFSINLEFFGKYQFCQHPYGLGSSLGADGQCSRAPGSW